MEFRQLTTFQTVARTLSFSKAARDLDYAQSTVSAQIHALESQLHVSLFDRLGKQVALTEAGKRLLTYADQLLSLAGEAITAVSDTDTPQGALIISAPETLCIFRLPKLLRTFQQLYPQVQLTFASSPHQTIIHSLQSGQMDIAIVLDEPIDHPAVHVEHLIKEEVVLVAHPEHPFAQKERIYPTDLVNEKMLLTEADCTYRLYFERKLAQEGIRLSSPVEFHSVVAIRECVKAGLGISLMPRIAIAAELKRGELTILPWAGDRLEGMMTQLVWHKDKWISPAMQAFLDAARKTLPFT